IAGETSQGTTCPATRDSARAKITSEAPAANAGSALWSASQASIASIGARVRGLRRCHPAREPPNRPRDPHAEQSYDLPGPATCAGYVPPKALLPGQELRCQLPALLTAP